MSTPPDRIAGYLADSRHIGLFMGSDSLKTVWPKVIEGMKTYSRIGEENQAMAV
jgi:hypothetical protein